MQKKILFNIFNIFFKAVSSSCIFALLLGHVAAVVEVTEEHDEAERVGQHHHVHGVREVAVIVQVVGGVGGHGEELQLGTQRGKKEVENFTISPSKSPNVELLKL